MWNIHILFFCNASPYSPPCNGSKILVFSMDGSHWFNMKLMIEELHTKGHSINVIQQSTSWYIEEVAPLYDLHSYTKQQNPPQCSVSAARASPDLIHWGTCLSKNFQCPSKILKPLSLELAFKSSSPCLL